MNEITLTVVAQILNFLFLWYLLDRLLLKKVFILLKAQKAEIITLEHSISLIRSDIDKEQERKKKDWKEALLHFSREIPYKKSELHSVDITPLCPVVPGLKSEDKKKLVDETVAYLVRKVVHEH